MISRTCTMGLLIKVVDSVFLMEPSYPNPPQTKPEDTIQNKASKKIVFAVFMESTSLTEALLASNNSKNKKQQEAKSKKKIIMGSRVLLAE